MHPEGGHLCVPRLPSDATYAGSNPDDCFGGSCAENMACSVPPAKQTRPRPDPDPDPTPTRPRPDPDPDPDQAPPCAPAPPSSPRARRVREYEAQLGVERRL